MFRFPFQGSRIMKTGIAVFITAFICNLLGWSPAFAVITAIVTIDPTVTDSLKKAPIRFTASAIGAFFAVLFVSLFGHTPFTYTLSAVFTIWTTYRLRLHDGLLVATLTAVAMVDVIQSHFLFAFVTRLGSTSIGLFVSIIVNLFISPPNYSKTIQVHLQSIRQQLVQLLQRSERAIVQSERVDVQPLVNDVYHSFQKTESFIRFQMKDATSPFVRNDKSTTSQEAQQFHKLQTALHHIEMIGQLALKENDWTMKERHLVKQTIDEISRAIRYRESIVHSSLEPQLLAWIHESSRTLQLSSQTVLAYELLALYQLFQSKDG